MKLTNLLGNLSIKIKLIAGFALVLIATVIVGVVGINGFTTMTNNMDSTIVNDLGFKDLSRQINVHLLLARRAEKNFFMRNDPKYVDLVKAEVERISAIVEGANALELGANRFKRLAEIDSLAVEYMSGFQVVVAEKAERGDASSGLWGAFVANAREMESALLATRNQQLQLELLQLRRQEKNYEIRGRGFGHVKDVEVGAAGMRNSVNRSNLSRAVKSNLVQSIDYYQTAFLQAVELDSLIEVNDAVFTATVNAIEPLIETNVDRAIEIADERVDALHADATQNSTLMIIVLIIAVIFGVIAALLILSSIINPINKMILMLAEIEQGEGDLTKRTNIQTNDEIGKMGGLFDSFMARLQDLMKQINNNSSEVSKASDMISSSAEQLAAGAEEQQAQLSEVATTMEQMSAMILQASNNANSTRENAQNTGRTANDGREIVSNTVTGFETVAKTVEQAAGQIQELSKRSEEIGNVIQVIDDVADQTNLLSLNANIEAARAGEAGRGFAVVADEVRKLAERTVTATAEISEMIESIQGDIGGAVKSMAEIQTQSNDGLQLVAKSDTSLEEIAGSITNVIAAVEQIATASNEQSSGAEEISKNIEGVSTVAKESATNAQS
ncbi:MAG: methyl-accepting chemotaxis protein, partial [Candidatus Marinimicrobia bacterium]|nr:methyl-accepting chemotaxis protein [Candidatus Neomarinimicrobiota bacterium]